MPVLLATLTLGDDPKCTHRLEMWKSADKHDRDMLLIINIILKCICGLQKHELLTLCSDDWAARTMCYDGIVYLDGKRQKCPLTIGGFCEKRSCFPASFLSCFLRKNDLLPRCWYLRSQFKKIKIKKYPCTCGLSLELKKMFPQCAGVFLQRDPTDGHRWRCF